MAKSVVNYSEISILQRNRFLHRDKTGVCSSYTQVVASGLIIQNTLRCVKRCSLVEFMGFPKLLTNGDIAYKYLVPGVHVNIFDSWHVFEL